MRANDVTATTVPPTAASARRTRSAAAVSVDEEHERPQSDREHQAHVAEAAQHLENHPGRLAAAIDRSPRHDRCVGRHAAAHHERERTARRVAVGRHDVPRHHVATVRRVPAASPSRSHRLRSGLERPTPATGTPVASMRRTESAVNVTDSLNRSVTATGATVSCAPADGSLATNSAWASAVRAGTSTTAPMIATANEAVRPRRNASGVSRMSASVRSPRRRRRLRRRRRWLPPRPTATRANHPRHRPRLPSTTG